MQYAIAALTLGAAIQALVAVSLIRICLSMIVAGRVGPLGSGESRARPEGE